MLLIMISDDQLIRQPVSSRLTIPTDPVSTMGTVDAVIERLIEILVSDTHERERKLPSEKELMIAFEVGRSSIREALRSLVAMNLLEIRQGKGYFVSPLAPTLIKAGLVRPGSRSMADFHEIMEARKVMELAIVKLALARATETDFKAIQRAGKDLVAAADEDKGLLPYTMRVHLAIVSAAHNSFLRSLFTDLLPWIMEQFTPVHVPAKLDVQMHIQLMEGFLDRNTEHVLKALDDHDSFWKREFIDRFPDVRLVEDGKEAIEE